MSNDLKITTRNAILWNVVEKVATQIVSVVVTITLALLLDVADFGLMGMLALFVAVSNALTDSGFSAALIRKEEPTEADYNTTFYFNLVVAFALYLILYFSAPLIAAFYDKPLLTPLSRVVFLSLMVNAIGLIQAAQLTKCISFKVLTNINVAALIVSGGAALGAAFAGWGVWALAVQVLTQSAVRTLLLWWHGSWHPAFNFSIQSFREFFAFGSHLTIANVLNALFLNLYALFIGKLFGDERLGYYAQAGKWSDMAIASIYGSVQNATYPIFSSIQQEKERLLRAYRKTIRLTAFITLPALSGLALISEPLIRFLFSDGKWDESIIYMQLLSVAGIFTTFTVINTNFIKIEGSTRTLLRLEYIKIALVVIVFSLTYRYSLPVIVAGQVLVRALVYLLNMVVIGRRVAYSWRLQLADIAPYAVLSLLMVGMGYLLCYIVADYLLLLLAQIVVCALFYYGANRWLHSTILEEVLQTLKRKKSDAQ